MNEPHGKLVSYAGICPICSGINFYYLDMPYIYKSPLRTMAIDPETMRIPDPYLHPKYCKKCDIRHKSVEPAMVDYARPVNHN